MSSILPLGRTAWSWLKQGGKPTRGSLGLRLLYAWQCFWFERNLSLQRRLPPTPPLQADPVFILGLWRSGTTYLHELLAACPGMHFPATWQCMNPSSFRLRSPPEPGSLIPRPMDTVMVDALSPQEDEFALLALGIPSVYRSFLDPRRLPDLVECLDSQNWAADWPANWVDAWKEFLSGVSARRPGRLVLKSPNHTFRLSALMEIFPKASYVWLVRDPIETFLSNRKMWIAMFDRYALWDWEIAALDKFLATAFELAAVCLTRAVDLLPAEQFVVIDYDQLTRAPLGTLEAINRRLRLGRWENMRIPIEQLTANRAGYRPDKYDSMRLPERLIGAAAKLGSAYQFALETRRL